MGNQEIPCPHCSATGELSSLDVEPTNEGRFVATCSAGHELNLSVGYHDFQILFEIGVNAIHDGYYREAVGSFTASYERFLEFFIRLVTSSSGVNASEIESSWKEVSSQSERQLGAFIFLYLVTYKEPPNLLSNSQVKLRNAVIHKGKIPTRDDCLKYGDVVKKIVLGTLRKLWVSHNDELVGSINEKWDSRANTFFVPWMILSTNREPPAGGEESSIEALVEGISIARKIG